MLVALAAAVLATEAVLLALPLARAGWPPAQLVLAVAALDALVIAAAATALWSGWADRDWLTMGVVGASLYVAFALTLGLAAIGGIGVVYLSI